MMMLQIEMKVKAPQVFFDTFQGLGNKFNCSPSLFCVGSGYTERYPRLRLQHPEKGVVINTSQPVDLLNTCPVQGPVA